MNLKRDVDAIFAGFLRMFASVLCRAFLRHRKSALQSFSVVEDKRHRNRQLAPKPAHSKPRAQPRHLVNAIILPQVKDKPLNRNRAQNLRS
jgi:hypothetical protein